MQICTECSVNKLQSAVQGAGSNPSHTVLTILTGDHQGIIGLNASADHRGKTPPLEGFSSLATFTVVNFYNGSVCRLLFQVHCDPAFVTGRISKWYCIEGGGCASFQNTILTKHHCFHKGLYPHMSCVWYLKLIYLISRKGTFIYPGNYK